MIDMTGKKNKERRKRLFGDKKNRKIIIKP